MLHEHANLKQQIKGDTQVPRGPICVGSVPTAMPIAARFAAMLQARHPALRPTVLSLSSADLEKRLNDLSVDLALGYTDRLAGAGTKPARLQAWPQYTEHYFLLRRSARPCGSGLSVGPKMRWKDAAALPLCLLTPDMHNRKLVDAAFTTAGATAHATIETNSILTLALSVVAGEVSAIMPGALIGTVRGYGELEALPLVSPEVLTPIGFMANAGVRPSLALEAALTLAHDGAWLRQAAAHSGLLVA
jgi:DNA-binding transcriptional LysR family regulator